MIKEDWMTDQNRWRGLAVVAYVTFGSDPLSKRGNDDSGRVAVKNETEWDRG